MPAMIRKEGKIKKITIKVMGQNPVLKRDNSSFKGRINRRLIFEETSRVR